MQHFEMPNGSGLPVIETGRLRLRGHCPDDLATCAAMWADPLVTRYIGGRVFSNEEVWARMLRYAGHWSWFGFGYWLVEEKHTGRFVGEVGFADHKRELAPSTREPSVEVPIQDSPELGWALATAMSGKGYATEAARAAIEWFEAHHQTLSTVCLIAPGNTASLRVAAKCGYYERQRTTYRGLPIILLARAPARWR